MTGIKLNLKFSFLFFLGITLLFNACTGSSQGKKPIDDEPVLGVKERYYYNSASVSSGLVLQTSNGATPTLLYTIASSAIANIETIDANRVKISSDGLIATILDRPGIFEYNATPPTDIKSGTASLPPATVDTYCKGLTQNDYTEFEVVSHGSVYAFMGMSKSLNDPVGGDGIILKDDEPALLSYAKAGFGTLVIHKQLPSSIEPGFFQANLQNAPSPWQNQSGLICHLNNVPVGPNSLSVLVDTFTASDNTPILGHASNSGQLWTSMIGSPVILGNLLTIETPTAPGISTAVIDAGVSDYTLTVDLAINVVNTNTYPAILFRYIDPQNYWYAQTNSAVNQFVLTEVNAGVVTNRAFGTKGNRTGTRQWSVSVKGATVTTTYDGAVLSYTSSSHQTATRVGLSVTGVTGDNGFGNLRIIPEGKGTISSHILFLATIPSPAGGNLGGLDGADAICATLAASAPNTRVVGGTWRAVLSTTTVNAKDHISFVPGLPIKNTVGQTIALSGTGLWSGSSATILSEAGALNDSLVTTGSTATGVLSSRGSCNDWTSNSPSLMNDTGDPTGSGASWLNQQGGYTSCSAVRQIYCVNSAQ